jgi:pyruvate formate lyase activating enzyme
LARPPQTDIAWHEVLAWLERRRGLLDAVVFSGGEPTLQRTLPAAVQAVRALGFKVGLHTAGCYPERLEELLPMLDWVGLDIKALPEDYADLTGVPGSGARAIDSLSRLVTENIRHEVRVTVHDALLPPPKLRRLIALLDDFGVRDVMLQRCLADRLLDAGLGANILSWPENARCSVYEWCTAAGQSNPCRRRHTGTRSTRESRQTN